MADELANGGENRCLIWQVFARRGLGESASQGSSFNRFDQVEAFDVPEDCNLGVDEQGYLDRNFIIYPNPSEGNINIKTAVSLGNVTVSIADMNGRNVFSQEVILDNLVSLKTNGLSAGVYVITIKGNTYSYTERLLIK